MDVLSEYGSHIRSPKLIRLTRFSTPRAHRQCLRPRGFCLTSTNEKQKRGKKETVKTPYAVTSLQIRHRRLEVSSHFGPALMVPALMRPLIGGDGEVCKTSSPPCGLAALL
jgi:hypothetical protein